MNWRISLNLAFILLFLGCSTATFERSFRAPSSQIRDCNILVNELLEEPRKFVNSFEDFYRHTELHVERIQVLAAWYYKRHSDKFPDLSEDLVREFMKLHDKAKLDLSLSNEGGSRESVLEKIYHFYNKNEGLTQEQLDQRFAIVDEINAIDDQVGMDFFRAHNLINESGELTEAAKQLKEIEKAVDITDRVMNEVSPEEFGRAMYPMSDNLSGEAYEMAKELEQMYDKLTRRLWYSTVRAIQ